MAADLPLKLLLITFAGFVNRDKSRLLAHLLEENRAFRELQGKKRLRLAADQLELGLPEDPRRDGEGRAHRRTHNHRQDTERQRHRTEPRPPHLVEYVL